MATINIPKNAPPPSSRSRYHQPVVNKFLGLNEDTSGDTQLKLGESPNMVNYRLTENFKLRKREGYVQLFASLGAFNIRGMWYGKQAGTFYLLFAANGHVYKSVAGVNTSLGTLTDDKTTFFSFADKVYILNGHDIYSWDGTTYLTVVGYRPVIATETPPAGGGNPNEQTNLLTGKKEQWFSPVGTTLPYQLAETAITSVDFVKNRVTGVTYILTTDYTVNLTTGVVTFIVAPTIGTPDSISIGWTKGTGSRAEVTGNYYSMFFGGQNDTRVFAYGDGSNRYYYTGLAAGVPSAEYWPALNYRDISSSEFAVTDIIRQYDRQVIHTNGGETWYSYYNPITDVAGNTIADFPTYPLNSAVGNIAYGQAQLIQNDPFSIQNGVYQWTATNVRDERNNNYISKRVQPSLDGVDLTTAITVDWEANREYWLAVGTQVWVFNYYLSAWYKFTVSNTITCLLVANNSLYFGTDNGQIMKFDPANLTDNGSLITCTWEMNFYDFNAEWLEKFMTEMWISLKPETKSSVNITYVTDRVGLSKTWTALYDLATFTHADFTDWSFLVNYNPQPFHFKIKAKKFDYFKLILTNAQIDEKLTVLSINLPVVYGNKVK